MSRSEEIQAGGDLVFVYGSLKRGQHNHGLLAGVRFVGEGRTSREFRLWATTHFPALVRDQDGPVEVLGELYEVGLDTLARLDELEENGELYQRERISIWPANWPNEPVLAWTYIWLKPTRGLKRLAAGLWTG